jgi:hypothetical protein
MQEDSDIPMFDVEKMEHFYDPKYQSDQEVLYAWYMYAWRFLPLCSKQWRECTGPSQLRNEQFMFVGITESDEALVQWLIKLVLPDLLIQKEKGWPPRPKSTGKGPQVTRTERDMYTLIHIRVEKGREDFKNVMRWNELFWDQVKKHQPLLFEKKIKPLVKSHRYDYQFPLPGLNVQKDYQAMYEAAKAITSLSPTTKHNENHMTRCNDFDNVASLFSNDNSNDGFDDIENMQHV